MKMHRNGKKIVKAVRKTLHLLQILFHLAKIAEATDDVSKLYIVIKKRYKKVNVFEKGHNVNNQLMRNKNNIKNTKLLN